MNAFSGFGKKTGCFWDLVMSKKTAALSLPGSAVIPKFRIYPPVQRIMKVDNSAMPEYTIIRGTNMDVNDHELWKSYFPLVVFGRIGDENGNNLYALLSQFIISRNNIDLLDIKGMAKHPVFSSLFPSETDPANRHWPKLEKELEKEKPVKIIEFFLEEEIKVFKLKYEERVRKQLPLLNVNLPDEFIKENKNNSNWIYYDNKENIFKYKCSNILGIPSPNFNSIYAAFRCYVPRYYADSYIRVNDNKKNIHFRKAIENLKESRDYFIPTYKRFIEDTLNLIPVGDDLKPINGQSERYAVWKEWDHYCKKLIKIFEEELMMEEVARNLKKIKEQKRSRTESRINKVVNYISELINNPEIREKLERRHKEKIDFGDLEAKINKYYDDYKKRGAKSLNDTVKGKDGEDDGERIDFQKDKRNYGTFVENIEPLYFLTSEKLEILRGKWLEPFKESFGKDKYAQCGQANFATEKVFERFIYWLVPYTDPFQLEEHLLLESELFKDYCRAHGLNGCKECAMVTHDISECKTCTKFKNEIYLLKPWHDKLIRKINNFFELIKNDKNQTLGEYDD